MEFRPSRVALGKARMKAWLMAVLALWPRCPRCMNEDLIAAAKRGDLPEVQRLLAQGVQVNGYGLKAGCDSR